MADPLEDFVPKTEQSPVVALLSTYGQPLRGAFFSLCAALPVFAMALLAGFEVVGALLASGLVAIVSFAGQLGIAIAIAWVMVTAITFIFVPGLALLLAILGVFLWARSAPTEQIAVAMATPVLTPLGLAPAMILTSAAVFGLTGVLTVAASAALTMVVAVAMGVQSLGAYAQTGLSLRQESLFNPVRAAEVKSALLLLFQNPSDRFGALGTQLDPSVLWSQMAGLVSRLATATLETWIATVLAWTIAGLTVWTVTRLLRTFFDTLLRRPKRWFALYVMAAGAGVGSEPFHVQGNLYLSGPYKGAPLSAVAITPVLAGPYDLGTVVVRTPLYLNPETAQLTGKSDPIPTILKGIPLKVRSVAVSIDRQGFTLNPTSCDAMAVTASLTGSNGATASPSNRFQVGGCDALKFAPKLEAKLKGAAEK